MELIELYEMHYGILMPFHEAEERLKSNRPNQLSKNGVDLDLVFLLKLMEQGNNMSISKEYRDQLNILDPLNDAIKADYADVGLTSIGGQEEVSRQEKS
jgi:hypothetical protein